MINPDLDSGDDNPYEFIFSKDKQVPGGPLGVVAGKTKMRQMIIFGLFAAVMVTFAIIAAALLLKKPIPTAPELVRVRALQTEIVRIIELGDKNAGSLSLRKKTASLKPILITDMRRVSEAIATRGVLITAAEIGQFRSTARDTAFTAGLKDGTHDAVYQETLDVLLSSYYQSIQAAQAVVLTVTEQSALTIVARNAEILSIEETATPAQTEEPATEEPAETTNPTPSTI